MAELVKKNFNTPDEKVTSPKAITEIVSFHDMPIARVTFDVGWNFSDHVKPMVGTESCQMAHLWYVISGRMVTKMDDGTQEELGPGDVTYIAPGHDAWVIGEEPCVLVDFQRISRL